MQLDHDGTRRSDAKVSGAKSSGIYVFLQVAGTKSKKSKSEDTMRRLLVDSVVATLTQGARKTSDSRAGSAG